MNKGQLKGVAEVLKKRFNNLGASETMSMCYDIVEVVLAQATIEQFPGWTTRSPDEALGRDILAWLRSDVSEFIVMTKDMKMRITKHDN